MQKEIPGEINDEIPRRIPRGIFLDENPGDILKKYREKYLEESSEKSIKEFRKESLEEPTRKKISEWIFLGIPGMIIKKNPGRSFCMNFWINT